MNDQKDKGFLHKLYIIIGLSSVIVAGLVYLIVSGGTQRIQEQTRHTPAAAQESAAHTQPAEPSSLPAASPSAVPTPSPAVVDIASDASLQRIVNQAHPIDPAYVPADLVVPDVAMNHTQMIRREAAEAMENLFQAAAEAGHSLYLISGYRSYGEQVSLYHTYRAQYGAAYAGRLDCHPGASEHQLGLAADFGTVDHACELDSCFADTGASQWLAENAWKYGWILRYPPGKEAVTGIMYSPWNYRYVGKEEAQKLHSSGLTMEEFYGLTD